MIFHWYGFIVGLAVAIVLWGLEYQYHHTTSQNRFVLSGKQLIAFLLLVLFGARLWHLGTDWQLYGQLSWQVLAVWQGGLSILGALVAGVCALWWLVPVRGQRVWLADALALWLPVGQAVGRVANWVNQELYGLPTTLPWGISIDDSRRAPGYEQYGYFHPLFAYEAVGLLIFAVVMRYFQQRRRWQLGSGKLALWYVNGYIWLRFWLDFIRIDRSHVWWGMGINQLILLTVGLSMLGWYVCRKLTQKGQTWQKAFLLGSGAALIAGWLVVGMAQHLASWHDQQKSVPSTVSGQAATRHLLSVREGTIQTLLHNGRLVRVVVMNSPTGRQQGLSGLAAVPEQGMLFVFEQPNQHLFWMKDMKFDLDFIWLRDGKVVEIQTHVPAPNPGADIGALPKYGPKVFVNAMLEVPAGTAELDGWQLDDEVMVLP